MFVITPGDVEIAEAAPTPSGGKQGGDDSRFSYLTPGYTHTQPEQVILLRAVALAKRSEQFLIQRLIHHDDNDRLGWSSAFLEGSSSLKSYSALLRINADLVTDNGCSTTSGAFEFKDVDNERASPFTQCVKRRHLGPKPLRRNLYKNLNKSRESVLHGWQPIESLLRTLRERFGTFAVFFCNELSPEVIAVLWRPGVFEAQRFTTVDSEYKRPVEDQWKEDSLVVTNQDDIIREIRHLARDIVVDIKVLDDKSIKPAPGKVSRSKRKASPGDESDSSWDE